MTDVSKFSPYLQDTLRTYGAEVLDWLLVLREDGGRFLPAEIEQRMRIEGMIKFKYRHYEAMLTRRGRRCARMIAEHGWTAAVSRDLRLQNDKG